MTSTVESQCDYEGNLDSKYINNKKRKSET